jgi:UDP-N-acetylmuramoyl-tripeptide--D-alanyl-D-alanine ligase
VAGKKFYIPAAQIKKAIEQYVPTNSRSQLVEHHGNKIILDAYNANPTSMAAAIENFAKLHAENKMLFIGGMMEMGEDSEKEHALVIQLIERFHWKDVILVGGDFAKVPHPYRYFSNSEEAAAWWKANEHEGNYLLVKGSRSMKMEKIVE